jgi:hypothetical protein
MVHVEAAMDTVAETQWQVLLPGHNPVERVVCFDIVRLTEQFGSDCGDDLMKTLQEGEATGVMRKAGVVCIGQHAHSFLGRLDETFVLFGAVPHHDDSGHAVGMKRCAFEGVAFEGKICKEQPASRPAVPPHTQTTLLNC